MFPRVTRRESNYSGYPTAFREITDTSEAGNINLIREQYNLAAGSTSIEDLLLQQRQIATDYRTNFSVGLSYTFGSIYNSIINTRL